MNRLSKRKTYRRAFSIGHWLMAGGFVLLLIAGQQFNFDLSEAYRQHGLKLHSSIGTIVLITAITLIMRRWVYQEPRPEVPMPPLKKLAANAVQLLLYALALFIPLSGMATALVSSTPTLLFGVVNLSQLAGDPELYARVRAIHEAGTWFAMVMIAAHGGAALYHHLVLKDDVLTAMLDIGAVKQWLANIRKPGRSETEIEVQKERG